MRRFAPDPLQGSRGCILAVGTPRDPRRRGASEQGHEIEFRQVCFTVLQLAGPEMLANNALEQTSKQKKLSSRPRCCQIWCHLD